jgi:4-hydroxybutyrate CoA-transferase
LLNSSIPTLEMRAVDYTNDTRVILRLDNMVAINSALQIDLTGQVCAESLGSRMYSGVGGQMDFLRGAALSQGGRPVIALLSTAQDWQRSRIVPTLAAGAAVTTTRAHVHWVVPSTAASTSTGWTSPSAPAPSSVWRRRAFGTSSPPRHTASVSCAPSDPGSPV